MPAGWWRARAAWWRALGGAAWASTVGKEVRCGGEGGVGYHGRVERFCGGDGCCGDRGREFGYGGGIRSRVGGRIVGLDGGG